jgi:polyhydroxyalkanoate synthesis regulator phasin
MPVAKRAATTTKTKSSPKSKTAKAASGSSAAKGRTTAARGNAAPARGKTTPAKGRATAAKADASKASSKTARSSASRASRAPSASSRTSQAASPDGGVISIAEQLTKGSISPKDIVMLTREHIQDALDDAASRGRVTRKDANELVAELVRRGRAGGDDVRAELESLVDRSRGQIRSSTMRAARSQPVDRIVRGADRARRAAGVGSSFPISGYPELNVSQVQARLKDLSKPELRKVLNYERKHANRKSVVGAIEKQL